MLSFRKMLGLVMCLLLGLPIVATHAQSASGPLASAAREAGLTILADILDVSGLEDSDSMTQSSTIFAPNDAAFAALPDFAIDFLLNDPSLLQAVLKYHIVPTPLMSDAMMSGEISTAAGLSLNVTIDDIGVDINDAQIMAVDIHIGDGNVVHVIDTVLIPSIDLPAIIPSFVEGNIIIAGSSTVFPLSDAIATRFRDEGYTGNITVDSIGSGAGFERFCAEGVTDISNASRPIKDAEIEDCHAIGRTVFPVRVGTDALAVVLNSDNDFVDNLTLEQLAAVFSSANTWQDINPDWPNELIERFIPGTDSGTFDYFVEKVFDDNKEPILAASRTSLSEDDNVLVTGVSGNPYAVGFFGFAYFDANRDALAAAMIDGIAPQANSVDAGTYPLARPLFMYAAPEIIANKSQVGNFLSYYLTVVNDEVEAVGYFPADPYGLNRARFLVKAASHN